MLEYGVWGLEEAKIREEMLSGSMKKVCVIGHFGFGEELLNGQTIKTKTVTAELEKQLGEEQVIKIDTNGGARALPGVINHMANAFRSCENMIIFPAQNGVRVFVPLCRFFNQFYHRKLHYVVIGGWLDSLLEKHRALTSLLKGFTGIYVETQSMQRALSQRGLANVLVMPNFKDIRILEPSELVYPAGKPYRVCTFSRVMQEKGIEDAVEAVKAVNEKNGCTVFTLDIYGQVDAGQTGWFEALMESAPQYIQYKGLVPYSQSVDVLKNYFALLFPTRFYTEGIPGTILDAYAAGVPVISSRWENFGDVVEDGVTGIGYEFGGQRALAEILSEASAKPGLMTDKKRACLEAAHRFQPDVAVQVLIRRL